MPQRTCSTSNLVSQLALLLGIAGAMLACEPGTGVDSPDAPAPQSSADDEPTDDDDDWLGPSVGSGGTESCTAGERRACFPFPSGSPDVGGCVAGVQVCEMAETGELAQAAWGPCEGAVGPSAEVCGDGVDADCDGEDPPCDGASVGSGGAGPTGATGAGAGSSCEPLPEVCGNGQDEDCDGEDAPCEEIDLDLFLLGDCITATCPASHPYPVACNVIFSPGDDRGCIASRPVESVVYFQAGDECNEGLIGGTLTCSNGVGAPLGGSNCPINKPIPIYAAEPDGCPEVTD